MSDTTIRLDPADAMRMIAQEGVTVRVCEIGEGSFYDGSILLVFDFPDGSMLRYIAEQENDYYGGHYDQIRWELVPSRPKRSRVSPLPERPA
jgi:hypothetical protein